MKYQFEIDDEIKACEECPCFDRRDSDCNISYEDVGWTSKPDDCPLKEVKSKEPCEYCGNGKIIKNNYSEAQIDTDYPATLEINSEGLHERIKTELTINFCPICGRELGEK